MKRALVVALLLAAVGCSRNEEWDQLRIAHARLHPAPCSSGPAVAGVTGVNADPREVFLGDWVVISVCHLDVFMKAAAAEQQPVTLFMNGLDTGTQPSGVDLDNGKLTFVLDRTEANKSLWKPLLYNPLFDRTVTIYLSVGTPGGRPLPRVENSNLTVRLNKLYLDWASYAWLGLLLVVVIVLWMLARRSDMLREGPAVAGVPQAYSLARAQMAWWFFLIVMGYAFIWMVTGDRDTIPPSLLGLMGISAATAVAAVAITPKTARIEKRREILDEEIAAVDKALQQLIIDLAQAEGSTSPSAGALRGVLEKMRADLEARRAELIAERAGVTSAPSSSGWWRDLVTDDRGAVALDRFQVVVWSFILGGVFLTSVLWDLTMPELSTTLLALMGISSGTYIGFKLPASRS